MPSKDLFGAKVTAKMGDGVSRESVATGLSEYQEEGIEEMTFGEETARSEAAGLGQKEEEIKDHRHIPNIFT